MKSPHLWVLGLVSAAILLSLALAGSSRATSEATIADLEVELGDSRLLLSFTLASAFDNELERRIESGLPTGFVFDMRLTRARKRWFDKDLAASRLQVVAMYNAVAREYLVNYKQNGDLVESRVLRDRQELHRAMTRFERLPAFALETLPSGPRVRIRVRAELGTRTRLFFIPTTRTTPWAESPRIGHPDTGRL